MFGFRFLFSPELSLCRCGGLVFHVAAPPGVIGRRGQRVHARRRPEGGCVGSCRVVAGARPLVTLFLASGVFRSAECEERRILRAARVVVTGVCAGAFRLVLGSCAGVPCFIVP